MKSNVLSNRQSGIDFLKFVCAFLVICIHIPFPGAIGTLFNPLIRIAVPVFFMITGYFYSLTKSKGREKAQIAKIFRLLIGSNILYFVYMIALKISDIGRYLKSLFTFDVWRDFILLNESPFSGHLWYLGALLYVLIILYFIEKKWDRKILYPIVPILLLVDLAFGKYSFLLFGETFPVNYVRNFLFTGLPCFLLGDMICRYKIQVKRALLVICLFVFYSTTLTECYMLEKFSLSTERENYISTIFLAVSVFLLVIGCKDNQPKVWLEKIAEWGRKYSLLIYILHPMVITVGNKVVKIIGRYVPVVSSLYVYLAPFIVLIATLVIAWLIDLTKGKFKNKA